MGAAKLRDHVGLGARLSRCVGHSRAAIRESVALRVGLGCERSLPPIERKPSTAGKGQPVQLRLRLRPYARAETG